MPHFFRRVAALFLIFQLLFSTPAGIAVAQEMTEGEVPILLAPEAGEATVIDTSNSNDQGGLENQIPEEPTNSTNEPGVDENQSSDEEGGTQSPPVDSPQGDNSDDQGASDSFQENDSGEQESEGDQEVDENENVQNDINVQNVQDIEIPQELELSEVLQLVEQGFLNKTLSRGDVAAMNAFLRSLDVPEELIREVLTRYPARDKRELKRSTLPTDSAVIPPGLLKKSSSSGIRTDSVPSSAPVEFVSDRILVKVSSRSVADQWIAESQSRGVEILVLQNDSQPLLRIDAVDNTSTVGLLQRYIQEPAVVYQEPDYVYHTEAVPNDSFYNSQWHHFNNGGSYSGFTGTAGEDIQSPDAWDIFTGNGNVIVAVIDTGVMFHHTDLQARMWDGSAACVDQNGAAISGGCPYHGYDFFDLDNNPNDESNHGTLVAGSIAAHGNNSTGVSGVNWNGKIMALKTGTADSSNLSGSAIVSSIYFAVRNGAKIINMSFSSSGESTSITNAIDFARTNGVLVLAAAGNDSLNLDLPGQNAYPCETALDNILCIAATNMQGTLTFSGSAATSNYGAAAVDFAAPGSILLTTGPIQTDLYVNSFENGATDVNKFILSGGSGWGLKDTGTNKMLTSHTSGSYTNNESTFAESNQTFNLSSYQSGTLFFEMNCVTDNAFDGSGFPVDGVAIDFSHDGGVTYQEAVSFNGSLTTLRGQFDVGPNGMPLITIGLLNDDFVNQFRFRFHFFSNSTTTGTGCDIDEVKLRVTSGSTYFYVSGTSFATPVTAGLASLIWEYDSALTYLQVRDLLFAGAEPLPALASNTVSGRRINAYRSLALMTDPAVSNLQGFLSDGGAEFFPGESISTTGPFFSWTAPIGQGIISGYTYTIDGIPDPVVDTTSLSVSLSGLTQGSHDFVIFAVNDVGVQGMLSTFSFTVDTLSPDAPTLLAVNGNNIVNASNESASVFSGTSVEAALLDYAFSDGSSLVTGSQSVAAGPFSLSNLDLSGLDDGTLSASVTLTDEAGNVSTPALFSVLKDIDIAVPTQLQLNGGIPINAAMASNVNLTFDTLEAGSALYTISNGINTNLSDTVAVTGGTTSTSINHTSLNDAVLNISVVFTDSAGNTASAVQTTLVKDTAVVSAAQVQLNGGAGVNAANAGATTLSFQAFESGSADYVISDGSLPDVTGSIGVAGAGIISVPNLNVSGLDDGSLTVSVTITDAVGNTAGVTTVSTSKDSQVSAATNVQLNGGVTILAVNQTAVNLTFATTEAGSATYVISDGSAPFVSGTVAVSGAGTTTVSGLDVSSLDDGTLNISVVFTDSVLNTAVAGTGSVQKDSEILAPTNVQLNGGVTINFAARNSVDLTFATTEAGSAAYSISDGSTTMNNTVAVSGAGTTTVTGLNVSSLNDGTLNLSVVLTDTPGNVSTAGSGTVGKDTTVSAATSVNLNGGAGVNSTTASNSSLVFDTLEAGSATYTISNGVASDVTGSTVVNGSGTTTVPGLDLSSFGDGLLNISVVFTDSVNNTATAGVGSSQKDVAVDSAANVQLNGGVVINAAAQSSVALTFETTESGSAAYTISDGVNPSLSGSLAVSGAGTTTVSALNVGALNNGTLNLSVILTDSFGNVSAAGTGSVIKDSDIPVAPQNIQLNGGVTINATTSGAVDLTGTVGEAGTLLYAVLDAQSNAVNGSQAVGAGAFTVSGLDLSGLNDGTLTVYVTLTDPAGNTSLDGNTTVQKDVVVQAAASVVLNNGSAVNATTQTGVDLTFQTNEAGSAQYTITDGTVSITNTVAVAGAGTTTVSTLDVSTLSDGTLNISVLFTDTAGNAAAAGTGTVAKDAEVPLAPQNVLLNGGVTILQSNQTSVTLTGTVGEAGTLEYQLSDGVNPALTGSLAVGVGAFTIPNINVSALNDGTISVLAHVTDAAANLSSDGVSNVQKDSQISSATNVQLNGGVTINASTYTSVTLAFDATEAGSADYVISDGSAPFVSGTVAVAGAGTTSISGLNLSALDDGSLNISVIFSDTAGNISAAGTGTVQKDILVSAPQNVLFNNQAAVNASTAGAVTLAGDVAEAGTLSYVISDGSGSVSANPAVASGAFSFAGINVSGLADGPLQVTVALTDLAGNTSGTTQVTVQKDTVISSPTSLVIQSGQPITSANEAAVSVTFSVTETGTVDYDFTDGVDTVSGSQVIAAPGAQNISSIDVSSLAEGTLTLTISFRDNALNIAGDVSGTVLKDAIANTPTDLVINGNQAITLANQSLVDLRVTLTETGDFVYTFTDGVHTVTDTVNVSTPGVVTVSNIDLSSMNEGTIMVDVTFTDDLGNVSLTVPGTIVKDTIAGSAAQVVLNAGLPVAGASAQSVALTFVVSEIGKANYSITDENNTTVSGTVPVSTVGLVTVTLDVSSLANGFLTPAVMFIDAVGNVATTVQGASIEKVEVLTNDDGSRRRRLAILDETPVSGGGGGGGGGSSGGQSNGGASSVLSGSVARPEEEPAEELNNEEEEIVLPFVDLSPEDDVYPSVLALYKKEIVRGQGNSDRFDPQGVVDWAQALKMLLMVTERKLPARVSKSPFPDVEISAWFAPYFALAKSLGFVKGNPDGRVIPWQAMNRAEAVVLVNRILGMSPEVVSSSKFSDVETGVWFSDALHDAVERGLLKTREVNGLISADPTALITRAEFVMLVVGMWGEGGRD